MRWHFPRSLMCCTCCSIRWFSSRWASFLKASGRPDRAAWLDASIWTIGVAAVLWELLIEPYMVDVSAGVLSFVVALAYPLLDLALLLMVLRMLAGRASLHPAYLLLTSAMLIDVVTDFVYGVRVVEGTYVGGELTDVGWMMFSLLLGAAALHPSMVKLTNSANRAVDLSSPRRLQSLLLPALAAPGLLLYQLISGDLAGELGDGLFAAVIVALIIVLVVVRGSGLLRVAEFRSAELTERTAALEVALDDRERVGRDLRTRVNQDALTGLASRDRFVEILQADIDAAIINSQTPSVAFLDLDDFKSVNDTLGHEAGDLLLVEVAQRIRAGLGPDQLVARFGGDEFAILIHGDAGDIAEHLVQLLRLPVLVHGRELRTRVSIGVSTARAVNCSSSDVLREADVAMYSAKRRGGGWARYESDMSSMLLTRLDLRDRLAKALQCGDIQPWFQPVVDLESGNLLGFEALARWCSEGIPILAPIEWLPFAEESGLVVEVDRAMLRAAVAQLAAWRQDAPDSELELAINLSGRTLQREGIDDEVIQVLNLHGVPAHRLVVEVTEGVLINDARVGDRLRRLRTAGMRIALDDFGTGWASLSYLRHLPVDHLKLDQSFTADLGRQPEADAIPSAIAHLARGLSLGLVAEGVETTRSTPTAPCPGIPGRSGVPLRPRPAPVRPQDAGLEQPPVARDNR